jgi:hypothetical protein
LHKFISPTFTWARLIFTVISQWSYKEIRIYFTPKNSISYKERMCVPWFKQHCSVEYAWWFQNILTRTCLTARLFSVTLEISRTACKSRAPSVTLTSHRRHWPLLIRVSGITWRGAKFLVNVILHTRYVSTCVGAVCGRGRETKIKYLNLPSLRMKVPDHVYEWPKTYTWSGTFILKDRRYTFFVR